MTIFRIRLRCAHHVGLKKEDFTEMKKLHLSTFKLILYLRINQIFLIKFIIYSDDQTIGTKLNC